MKIFKRLRELYVLYFVLGKNQRKWLLFLKHNPDKQLKGKLGEKYPDGTYKVCCLGAAGLMFGYCKWEENALVNREGISYHRPSIGDNENFLKLRNALGADSNTYPFTLAEINDSSTWLDVYWACINNPKEYFTGKI